MEQRFSIGTRFRRIRKHDVKFLTVVDVHKTYNSKEELVKIRYVCTYLFMNQIVTDYDVTDTEIARSLAEDKPFPATVMNREQVGYTIEG